MNELHDGWLALLREGETRNRALREDIQRVRRKVLEELREGDEASLFAYLQEAATVTSEMECLARELVNLDHQLIGLYNEIAQYQDEDAIQTEIDPDDFTLDLDSGHDNQWCWCLNNQTALSTMEVNRLCSIDLNLVRIRDLLRLGDT